MHSFKFHLIMPAGHPGPRKQTTWQRAVTFEEALTIVRRVWRDCVVLEG